MFRMGDILSLSRKRDQTKTETNLNLLHVRGPLRVLVQTSVPVSIFPGTTLFSTDNPLRRLLNTYAD